MILQLAIEKHEKEQRKNGKQSEEDGEEDEQERKISALDLCRSTNVYFAIRM